MTKIMIECGTKQAVKFEIDIDNYGLKEARTITPEEEQRALALLQVTMDDYTFADDGYRNEDAVNSCIALHVLGFDPAEWFENFFDQENGDQKYSDKKFFGSDVEKFMEHVERVCKYLLRWGPDGSEGNALKYSI